MLSDGTNSYSWDAENRMIKITYPGTNNFSSFVYDAFDQNISIVETTAGSVTSTKQFIWCGDDGRCEERDGSGTVTKRFFSDLGQTISGASYFYNGNHENSINELIDSTGNIQAQYRYDPFGRVTKLQGSLDSDFQYAGYYAHTRSLLNITDSRAYNAVLGRWIQRDPIEEMGGVNLFGYVDNDPVGNTDPSGLAIGAFFGPFGGFRPSCNWNPPNKPPKKPGGGNPPPPPPPPPPGPGGGGGKGKTPDDDDGGGSSGGGGGGGGKGPKYDDPQRGKGQGRAPKGKGKGTASNFPSWAKGITKSAKETAQQWATKLLDAKYGKGNWSQGAGTEYNQLVKAANRGSVPVVP
jgi:RHS repeat-associated protein